MNAAGGIEALRERAAASLEQSLGFVEKHGDDWARLRAEVALRVCPSERAVARLVERCDAEGGFTPSGASGAGLFARELAPASGGPELRGALEALGLLAEWGELQAPCVERIALRLSQTQLADGSWGDAVDAPERRLVATGLVAGLLGRSPFARPGALAGASRFLGALWSPDRLEGGDFAVLTAYACLFANVPDDLSDEGLQWCGRELERGYRSRRLDALAAARLLLCCDVAALPGSSLEPPELVAALLDEQAADGGFAALEVEGSGHRAAASVDAMRALIGLCAGL